MASYRFLTLYFSKIAKTAGLFTVCCLLLMSCGTTQETQSDPGSDLSPSENTGGAEQDRVDEEFREVLNDTRSTLRDAYAGFNKDIPAVFRQKSEARDIGDPTQGYRIQILSTRNIEEADEMATDFRMWADEEFTEYIPKVYVLFRQPYYKVHIGNFQFHDQAVKLNRFLKSRYPDAWVVHDEVDPELVPTDSLQFQKNK